MYVVEGAAAEQIGSVHRVSRIPQRLRERDHPFGQPACVMEKQDLSHSAKLPRGSDIRALVGVAVCLPLRAEVGVDVVLLTPSLSQDGVRLGCIRARGVLVGPVRLGEVPARQIAQGAGD